MAKVLLLIATTLCLAVQAQKIPEPEFPNRPYAVHADGSLKSFERVDNRMEYRVSGLAGKNQRGFYVAYNDKSTFRFQKFAIPKCVINIGPGKDPADLIKLYRGKAKKGERSFLYDGKPEEIAESLISIEFKKISEGFYEIILPMNLTAGEYMLVCLGDMKLSCFGVDE